MELEKPLIYFLGTIDTNLKFLEKDKNLGVEPINFISSINEIKTNSEKNNSAIVIIYKPNLILTDLSYINQIKNKYSQNYIFYIINENQLEFGIEAIKLGASDFIFNNKHLEVLLPIKIKNAYDRLNTPQIILKLAEQIQTQSEEIQASNEELNAALDGLYKSNEELEIKEKKWLSVINEAPWGMHFYELDAKERLIFKGYNNAANKILKFNHESLIGKTIQEAFPGLINTEIPIKYANVAKTGENFYGEQINYNKEQISGAFEVRAFQTEKNKMVASFVDITQKKIQEEEILQKNVKIQAQSEEIQAQNEELNAALEGLYRSNEELKIKEKRLCEAQRIAKIANFERNLKTKEEFWSEEMFNLLGYQKNEIKISEEIFLKHVYPDDNNLVKKEMTDLLAFKDTFSFEYRMLTKQNDIKYIYCSGNIIRDKKGKPIEVEGVLQDITERKKIEITLKENQTNLKILFDSVEEHIILMDKDTQIIFVNNSFLSFYQLNAENVKDLNYESFLPDNSKRTRKKFLEQAIQNKKPITFEDLNEGKYWLNNIYPIIENKEVIRIAFLSKDISLLKNAELKEKETAFLQAKLADYAFALNACTTLDDIQELVGTHLYGLLKDVYLVVSYIDPVTQKARIVKNYGFEPYLEKIINLTGRDPRELQIDKNSIGQEEMEIYLSGKLKILNGGLYSYSSRKIPQFVCKAIEKLLGVKQVYTHGFVFYGQLHGGITIFVKNNNPLELDKYIEAVVNQTVIVLNKLIIESNLRESEERYRSVIMNVGEGIGILDVNGNFLFTNPATEIIFAEKENSLLGKNIKQFIDEEQFKFFQSEIIKTKNGKKRNFELNILIDKNTVKTLHVSATPHLNPMGNFAGTFNTFRDITLQKKNMELQQNLEIANNTTRLKQQFLANMSHEMRTPMNGIIGMTEFLSTTELNETQKEYVKIISEQSKLLLSLINDVLDLSRIEAGHIKINETHINLQELTKKIENTFSPFTERKKIGFSVYSTKGFPNIIVTDEIKLFQIISNLISNAIKFTELGYVVVSFHLKDSEKEFDLLEVRISDTGIGIKKEDKNKIFENFTQLEQSKTKFTEGTGLGLSITKNLVKVLGGEIDLESEFGRGTTFWFTFKSKKVENNKPIIKTNNLEAFEIINLVILLVEDKFVNRKVAEIMLKNLGCEVDTAENGAIALDLISKKNYEVVFMDIQMPIMDGVTATKEIKKLDIKHPVIIGLSAEAMEGDSEKYIAMGMDDYLTKPITTESVYNKLLFWKNKIK